MSIYVKNRDLIQDRIAEMFHAGFTDKDIADDLKRKGYRTIRNTEFTATTISSYRRINGMQKRKRYDAPAETPTFSQLRKQVEETSAKNVETFVSAVSTKPAAAPVQQDNSLTLAVQILNAQGVADAKKIAALKALVG